MREEGGGGEGAALGNHKGKHWAKYTDIAITAMRVGNYQESVFEKRRGGLGVSISQGSTPRGISFFHIYLRRMV